MSNSKTCTKCGQVKSLQDFHKDKRRSDGLFPQCKTCVLDRMKLYAEQKAEEARLRARNWYYKNQDRAAIQGKLRREKHKEKIAEQARLYRLANRERLLERQRIHYQKNKQMYFESARKRRALEKHAFLIRKKDLMRLLTKPCAYCGAKSEHIDHVIPLIRGGQHKIGNLIGACALCNLQKNKKLVSEWKKGQWKLKNSQKR